MTRYEEYLDIIENIDLEQVTDVEVNELIEEMAADKGITDQEYNKLYYRLLDIYRMPF